MCISLFLPRVRKGELQASGFKMRDTGPNESHRESRQVCSPQGALRQDTARGHLAGGSQAGHSSEAHRSPGRLTGAAGLFSPLHPPPARPRQQSVLCRGGLGFKLGQSPL